MNAAVKLPIEVAPPNFKGAMRQMEGGISVVTAGDVRTGRTAPSTISLSMKPSPMVVAINRAASAWPEIQRRRHFCVNALASHHRPVADRFAGQGGVTGLARAAGADGSALSTGALALKDPLASIDCEVEEFVERRRHAIVIGAVRAQGGEPPLYRHGRYGAFAPV